MKRTLSRGLTLLLCLTLLFQLPVLAAEERTAPQQMADFLTEYGVASSVQFALMQDGEVVVSGHSGVYSKTENRALTPDIMYGAGSVSKMFTTVVIMKLADQGLLELDTPVIQYLPQFNMADPRYVDITVRHLLNHSSGLMGSTFSDAMLWDDADTVYHDTLLNRLSVQRLKADPGAYSVYCNDGFTLLELIAEAVSGQGFSALVHQWITTPLGMENTKTPVDEFDRAQLAKTYSLLDPTAQTPVESLNAIGTGGIYSTAQDLAALGQIFTLEADILSEASVKATMEKEYLNGQWLEAESNIIGYGLGWDSVELYPFGLYGITALSKGGDTGHYHASLIVLPEYNMSAAVMSSGSTSENNQIIATELLLQHLRETGKIEEYLPGRQAPDSVQAPLDVEVEALAGAYGSFMAQYTVSFDEQGSLLLVPFGAAEGDLFVYIGGGKWVNNASLGTLSFVQQEGRTYLVQDVAADIPGFGHTAATVYLAQQLPPYTPDEETLAAFAARNGMLYLNVTEKYSSISYSYQLPAMSLVLDAQNPGYMVSLKLQDPSTLAAVVEIPMSAGRDLYDVTFYTDGGVEYATAMGNTYMSMLAVPQIWGGSRSICTIQATGHTRWYMVGAELEGKTITIDCPEGSGFAVYNAYGLCDSHSALNGSQSFVAAAGQWIAMIGDPGAVFSITVQ